MVFDTTSTSARPARQARSRRTLSSLLDALDRLLRDRPFESITVVELATEAKVSTGAFYARFAAKEDLLPELYSRFQESLEEIRERELDPDRWVSLSARERLERAVEFVCEHFERRPWLLRAVAIHSRRRYTATTEVDRTTPTAQVRLLRRLADCVGSPPLHHDDRTREQVEFALYTVMTLAREAVLFPHLPMAASFGLDAGSLRERLTDLLQQILGRSLEIPRE